MIIELFTDKEIMVILFRDEGTLYSFLYPAQNQDLIDALAKKKITAFGMDCVPRISRAQVGIL